MPSLPPVVAPITILHVITGLGVGGAERQLVRLVTHSDPRRFRHHVVSLMGRDVLGQEIEAAGLPLHVLNMSGAAGLPLALGRLIRLLRHLRPDVVQSWLYHADLLASLARPLASLGWGRGPKLLWNIRCSDMQMEHYSAQTRLIRAFLARLSAWPDGIVTNSQAGQRSHEALGYHPRRWICIPNGIDTDLFQPDPLQRQRHREALGVKDDELLVGLVARIDPMKNQAGFVAAAAGLAARFPQVRFALIGRGSEIFPDQGLGARLLRLGERADLAELTNALDIAVSTSLFGEGFSNALAEAMACGKPCVATDVGDASSILEETGWVVPPGNGEAFAAALGQMIALSPAERAARGEAARQRILSAFTLEANVNRYESLYEDLAHAA